MCRPTAAPGRSRAGPAPSRCKARVGRPLRVLVLLQVVRLGQGGVDQDRLGRGDRRACPSRSTRMSRVSRPGFSRHSWAAISPVVYIWATPGASSSPLGHLLPVVLLAGDQPVLLAGGVEVVAPAARHASTTSSPCWANGPTVLQTTPAPSNSSVSGSTCVLDLDDLVLDRLDARDVAERLGDPRLVPAGRDERDVELAQVLADQPPGVAGGAVHDDVLPPAFAGLLIVGPPSHAHAAVDRQPGPVMNLAPSEARNTTASAMSATSPSRPSGVRSMTAPAAASALG